MGFEAFRVELRGGPAKYQDAVEAVRQIPHARPDPNSMPMKESTYYLIEDGLHTIEVEVMDAPVKISCRFTLAHPASVDRLFMGTLQNLMTRLEMQATIRDDVLPAHARSFTLAEFADFSAITKRYIDARRAEWIAAFGIKTVGGTISDVYQRVILRQCQPEVEQAT
ncbi:MAG: hypothetical protein K8T89_10695 [Planctomycetes bacterium]|nr:hypothetical protein [Planctomycetota bacterium]